MTALGTKCASVRSAAATSAGFARTLFGMRNTSAFFVVSIGVAVEWPVFGTNTISAATPSTAAPRSTPREDAGASGTTTADPARRQG